MNMSKSLTFNQASAVQANKQAAPGAGAGMTDAMLRKQQYKQHANQSNSNTMEQ